MGNVETDNKPNNTSLLAEYAKKIRELVTKENNNNQEEE